MVEDFRLKGITNFLKLKHINISVQNEWLQGCCSWYYSNNSETSIQDVQNFVYEQWLLADLRDIGESTLPANIMNIPKMCIKESYALQVDCVLDVGKSAYSQLQKIRNISTTNLDVSEVKMESWQPKDNRMLKLTCTDGVQTIYGMEYALISNLKEPFIPGFKILIVGPVECRRGVLLLQPQNIQILGGEADSLIIKNATENVLARILNVEENPDPFHNAKINETDENTNEVATNTLNMNATDANRNSQDSRLDPFLDDDDDIFLCNQLTQVENQYNEMNNCNRNITNITNNLVSTNTNENNQVVGHRSFLDNSLRNANEFSSAFPSISYANNSRSFSHSNNINNQNGSNKKDKTPIIGVACPIMSTNTCSFKRSASSPTHLNSKVAKSSSFRDNICDSNAISTMMPNSGQNNFLYSSGPSNGSGKQLQTSKNQRINVENLSLSINSKSTAQMVTLNDIKKQFNLNCSIVCFAEVVKLTSKPRIRNEMWQLSAEIKDRTDILEVEFTDTFLENMFGYSALEIFSQKERIKMNTNVKENIDKILKTGVQKVLSLSGRFQIEFIPNNNPPKVTGVI